MLQEDQIRYTRRRALWLYSVLSLVILAAGYFSYVSYEAALRPLRHPVRGIVNLMTPSLLWRLERITTAMRAIAGLPDSTEAVRARCAPPEGVTAWLDTISATSGYSQVSLLDASGSRLLASPPTTQPVDVGLLLEAEQVMRTGEVGIADFHRDGPGPDQIHLSVVVPVIDRAGTGHVIGAVALKVDPNAFLYPYIAQWPGGAKTGETLLVDVR